MQVRTESSFTVSVRTLNERDRPPRRFAPGRECAEPDCDTHISIYNETEYCSLHLRSAAPRTRGKKVV